MRILLGLFTLAMLLGLSGCATSSAPANRFMLPDSEAARSASPDVEQVLLVRTPRLAHYLDVDGIVLQLDDISLNAARQHLWAEPLGRQLERGMRARLSERLVDTRVLRDEGGHRGPNALLLRIEVDSFQGRYDGLAVASGQWQLLAADGELVAMDNFRVETELDDDGYPALVRALGRSWDQVADQVAATVSRHR
ncbi:hypothetical protein DU490_14145 [Halomonas sp. DQ26W]|uniref:PqiC family protein n=1 Tax=Halomonas sp. DQ26W TaxID=2282311 RepID=UPI000DF824A9|nr:ABC-type transport auxiliary lipoprotein family protein [Halomonas sp. DQ26W]RDB42240.1 hypothetical protein DU490_14145 [Halomonas sp. DQ26W]